MNAAHKTILACWCGGQCPHMPPIRELTKTNPDRPRIIETALKTILLEAPDCPEAHRALAWHYNARNHAAAAAEHLERARAVTGLTAPLSIEITNTLRNAARVPAAIKAGRRAVALNPDNVQAFVALASALQADGQLAEAQSIVEEAERKFARTIATRRLAAVLLSDAKDYAGAIARLSAEDLMPIEYFDRGRCHESLGHYAEAWRDWMAGKRIQREQQGMIYPQETMGRRFAYLAEMARPARASRLPRLAEPGARPWPIFITGFPRSGTTMTEAALAAHPDIAAGDELPFLPELIERLPAWTGSRAPFPHNLMSLSLPENAGVPELARDFYLRQSVHKIGIDGEKYFTDKMCSNEHHLLLIRNLFPGARIVHVRRHPLDIIVSNMSHHLIHGAYNACSLEWCATHYAATDALVAHYKRQLPDLPLIEIRYESFVADHYKHIDSMLPADLAPSPACYDFHLSKFHSRTISYRQIKQPVNDRSIGRYKPFLEFLRPIVPVIQATLDREGYQL